MLPVNNTELIAVKKNADHVKRHHDIIEWIPTLPECVYELKSKNVYDKASAEKLKQSIIQNESPNNQKAFDVFESRSEKGKWRIVVNLEKLHYDNH